MDLDAMEKMANENAGETPQQDTLAEHGEQSQEQEPMVVGHASALDIALLNKTQEEQIHILKATVARGLDKDDPVLDIYNVATSSARSANSTATAAMRVAEGINSIPKVLQDAVIAGAGDIRGGVHQAFLANFEDLKKAVGGGIKAGASASITLINDATKKLTDATQALDSGMDKAIIAKRDAVLSQWVQSGSDALDKRIREAIKTERTVNLTFILFAIAVALVVGIVLGIHLH